MKRDVAIITGDMSIKEAIQSIEKSRFDTGFALDGRGRYRGTISIGDLRRLLISGVNEADVINGQPCSYNYAVRDTDLKSEEVVRNTLSDLTLQGIEHIPVLGADEEIVDVLSLEDLRQVSTTSQVPGSANGRLRRILIVGGAGYLGSVLATKLLGRGYTVRILDNFLYGKRSLEQIPQSAALEIIEGDLRNIHTCVSALDRVHAVVLLAAIVGDPASKIRPRETIETNVIAAQALAAACKLQCINRFLYASTCSVYGSGNSLLDENAELRPVSLYARTKIASEQTILSMGDGYFAPTILRMGTLYGYSPRMRFDLVVNTMTMNAFSEGRIRVFGGKQWRPLLSVQDAAEAYVHCIEADIASVGNQVFNIGSDEQNYQIENIARVIAGTLGTVDVQHDDKSLDVRDYRVSFKKVHDVLAFHAADTVAAASRKIYSSLANGLIPDPSHRIYYNHFFDVTEE
ncbi:MAG: NAD-dependent epimerase/dehydratase family protein [Acidobacteriia bacterium]|nr:NAD-dependent epimerase/dehydratase family protein [Terriglobia bacterium]